MLVLQPRQFLGGCFLWSQYSVYRVHIFLRCVEVAKNCTYFLLLYLYLWWLLMFQTMMLQNDVYTNGHMQIYRVEISVNDTLCLKKNWIISCCLDGIIYQWVPSVWPICCDTCRLGTARYSWGEHFTSYYSPWWMIKLRVKVPKPLGSLLIKKIFKRWWTKFYKLRIFDSVWKQWNFNLTDFAFQVLLFRS